MRLRFAARDPGGANVLAAFLRSSWFQSPSLPDIWTMPHATARFEGVAGQVREFPTGTTAADLASAWRADPADALVTGTSHYEPFEAVLWDVAAGQGVPSLAVLDQWMNLGSRFRHGRPQFVAALDETQARDLAAIGFDARAILVAGNPWLAEVRRRALALGAIEQHRDDHGVNVLFVSEPIASDVSAGYNRPFGFDEIDSFTMLHTAAVSAVQRGLHVHLEIRCHPYEDPEAFQRRVASLSSMARLNIRFSESSESALGRVLWADLVCGIGSTLLLEAMVLRRPVISLQPSLSRENVFVATERGWADTLTDAARGQSILVSLLTDAACRAAMVQRHEPLARAADERAGASIAQWLERQPNRVA